MKLTYLKNLIRNTLEKIIGIDLSLKLFLLYRVIKNPKEFKILFYKKKNDLDYNKNLFKKLDKNFEKVIKILNNELNIKFDDERCSWHYHIFSSFQTYEKINILEIGTFDGKFANFLSSIFPNAEIYTLDLPDNDPRFISSYRRKDDKKREQFIIDRNKRLQKKNIFQLRMDSKDMINKFEPNFFDYIWIDGDHRDPQVSTDIENSIKLVKSKGIICCDDVIMKSFKNEYVSNESYLKLDYLEKKQILINNFFVKRCTKNNAILKKFISVSYLKNKSE